MLHHVVTMHSAETPINDRSTMIAYRMIKHSAVLCKCNDPSHLWHLHQLAIYYWPVNASAFFNKCINIIIYKNALYAIPMGCAFFLNIKSLDDFCVIERIKDKIKLISNSLNRLVIRCVVLQLAMHLNIYYSYSKYIQVVRFLFRCPLWPPHMIYEIYIVLYSLWIFSGNLRAKPMNICK